MQIHGISEFRLTSSVSVGILVLLSIYLCCCSPSTREDLFGQSDAELPEIVDFNFHIRPILSDRCYKCHGPDENARKAGLRLDMEADAFAKLDSAENRYAIVPGKPDKSHLYKRVASDNPDYMMPPPDSKLTTSEREVALLRRWIEQGAEWKKHWAFIPPSMSEIPEVSDADWPVNPIDNFILSRLDREGLSHSTQASREKLIRRLSFDLRGIPPGLDEIDAFLSENSPEAYEDLVDRFLGSGSYGERLALEWMDLARYADSHGYQDDLERTMWPWRDWVISAFNKNMPYDQFVTWQLAGDLLPDASYEQVLATGFNRNHKITQEVGVVEEEYRVEYVLDRVNTFSTSFLGLTVGCAQCHDHKFDPISQREFYSLFSFFNNVPEQGRVDYGMKIAEPSVPIPDSLVTRYSDYMNQLVRNQEAGVREYEQSEWEQQKEFELPEFESDGDNPSIPDGLVAYYPFDYLQDNRTFNELDFQKPALVVNGVVPRSGKFSGGLDFSGENHLELGVVDKLDLNGPVTISFWFYTVENGARGTILAPKSPAEGHKSGFELNTYDDGIRFSLNQHTDPAKKGGSITLQTTHVLPGNQWVHIVFSYDGSKKAKGVKIYLNGQPLELLVLGDNLVASPVLSKSIMIGKTGLRDGFRANPQGLFRARVDELMLFNRVLTPSEVQQLSAYEPLKELLPVQTAGEHARKRLFFNHLHRNDPGYRQITRWLSEYKYREMRTTHLVMKPTMVMAEMDTIRPAYVLERGLYSNPTERVYPATPTQILPFPVESRKNRLGLANWLFDKKNPLTARVAANRYWQMIFGRGIVSTPEDFGSQGDLPSHPELLDWLALEFADSGWDLKRLLKMMVMSASYRQSVAVSRSLEKRDPNNILLARGPQVRLQAELVRDHALNISGLLSEHVGGPSVNPYQPKGLWLQVASGNQELKEYIQGHGRDLYRKSMYTFWKRSLPPPSMIIFDAATREQCAVKRQSTSTPMQALVLLNDPQFTEASRLLAQRMMVEGGSDEAERIRFAFRLATSRNPHQREMDLLMELYRDQLSVFQAEPDRARSLLQVGEYGYDAALDLPELASYTVLAKTIMNLSETILKG